MKIPRKLKIGAQTWTVTYSSIIADHGNFDGRTDLSQQNIILDPSLPVDKIDAVFFHELLHALLAHTGLDKLIKDYDTIEEGFVTGLSVALYQVLKDNKLLK